MTRQSMEFRMRREETVRTRSGWRWVTAIVLATSLLSGILVTGSAKAQNIKRGAAQSGVLTRYTLDLTAAAEQGRLDSSTDRRSEINRAIEILSSGKQNNPGFLQRSPGRPDGVGLGVAPRNGTGYVAESLYGKRLLKLNLDALFH